MNTTSTPTLSTFDPARVARRAAQSLDLDPRKVEELSHDETGAAFSYKDSKYSLLIQVDLCETSAQQSESNRTNTLTTFAAGLKPPVAPRVYPVAEPCVLVQDRVEATLTRNQTRQPEVAQKVMEQVHQLHTAANPPFADLDRAHPRDFSAGARARIQEMEAKKSPSLVTLDSLRARFDWLASCLQGVAPSTLKTGLGDLNFGTLGRDSVNGTVQFLNLRGSGQQDPSYDLARFAFTSRLDNAAVLSLAPTVAGHQLTPAEEEHQLAMGAMVNTDYLAYFTVRGDAYQAKAQLDRARQDEFVLKDMPSLRLSAPNRAPRRAFAGKPVDFSAPYTGSCALYGMGLARLGKWIAGRL